MCTGRTVGAGASWQYPYRLYHSLSQHVRDGRRRCHTFGLIEIVSNSNELGTSQVIGKSFTLCGRPGAGAREPCLLRSYHEHLSLIEQIMSNELTSLSGTRWSYYVFKKFMSEPKLVEHRHTQKSHSQYPDRWREWWLHRHRVRPSCLRWVYSCCQ